MILQAESTLTIDQYAAILDAVGDPTLEITLERYTPVFTNHDGDGSGEIVANFDVIQSGNTLIRAYHYTVDEIEIDLLANEDGGDQVWASQTLTATDIVSTVVVSLAIGGDTVRVFWYDGTNIKYHESIDNGANWGAAQTVGAVSDLTLLAATSLIRVHYFAETIKHNHRLHIYEDDGGWAITDSAIYWPFKPTSFDAITGFRVENEAEPDNDILCFATDYPMIISAKIVGTTYTQYLVRVQGLAFIRYQNGRWSEHHAYDVIDRCASFPSRSAVKLTSYGGWLFLSYHRLDGEFVDYTHLAIALSRSKDGLNWEAPYLVEDILPMSAMVIHCNTFVYLVGSKQCYRSKSTGYFDDPQITLDVSNYVSNVSAQSGQIQSIVMALENPGGVLDIDAVFTGDTQVQARIRLGYHVDGDALLVPVAVVDVNSYGNAEQVPTTDLEFDTLDELGRLNTTTSDQAVEHDSQIVGGDHFRSSDGTDYSGLRHTAGQEGAWKAPDGDQELVLITNESPGTAFNTFCSFTWNGSAQCGINLPSTTSDDYAGLVFRAYDKRNLWAARYNADRDTIELIDRKDNVELRVLETAAMTWAIETWYWLKVIFRYGYIWVYSSTDGYTWTESLVYEIPGQLTTTAWTWDSFIGREIQNLDGRMGFCGTGYSTEDNYYPPPPEPSYPEPPVDPEPQDQWIVGTCDYPASGNGVGVFYTDDIESVAPSWFAMNNGLNTLGSLFIHDLKIKEWITGYETLFAATYCGIYEYENLPAPTGEWKKRITSTYIAGLAGKPNVILEHITNSIEHEGLMACVYSYNPGVSATLPGGSAGVVISEDGFKTITRVVPIISLPHLNLGYVLTSGSVCFAQHSDGNTLYCGMCWSPGGSAAYGTCEVWKSIDRGATWSLLKSLTGGYNTFLASRVWVPYHSESFDDSVIYWAVYTDLANTSGLYRSVDSGATWEYLNDTSLAGLIYSCAGPTWNKNMANYTQGNYMYEYHSGDVNTNDHTSANVAFKKSFVMRRGDGLLVSRYLIAGKRTVASAGPVVYLHDVGLGTTADKTGDLITVAGTTTIGAYVLARKEYSSLEQRP